MRTGLGVCLPLLVVVGTAGSTTLDVPGTYSTIQAAIDVAAVGDTVAVAAGTYDDLHHPGGADTTQCVVSMKSGVTLLGAGPSVTTIDALLGGRGILCDGVTNAHIEGFTITRAFAQVFAAGLLCANGSSPTVNDCVITACDDGGVICNDGSSPQLTNCDITFNESKQGGGVAMETDSSPTFTDCTITDNAAPVAGGVYAKNNCAPVFERCAIDDNTLNTLNGKGGGIALTNAQITLIDCTVNRNVSSGVGGGIHLEDGSYASLTGTRVQDNSTTADYGPGGGIYSELSEMDLDHCTITGNVAPGATSDGGALFLFFATATTIRNCTIADNGTAASPDGLGAGITCFAFADPVIENTILAANGPGQGLRCVDGSSTPVVICSDIWGNEDGDAICGVDSTGNFSADPLFCDLGAGDFSLDASSPCLGGACGQVGAYGAGTCTTDAPIVGGGAAILAGPTASPNPFRTASTIRFDVGRAGPVTVDVFDVRGRRVRRLLDQRPLDAGAHRVVWDGHDDTGREVASGVYFCRLAGETPVRAARIVLRR